MDADTLSGALYAMQMSENDPGGGDVETNGWQEYKRLVMDTLEAHTGQLEDLEAKIDRKVGSLDTKVWGLILIVLAAVVAQVGAYILPTRPSPETAALIEQVKEQNRRIDALLNARDQR